MREVLYGAVAALLLVVAFASERHFSGGAEGGGAGRTVDILAYSTGESLEPAVYSYQSRAPDAAIFVGDLTLRDRQERQGIRVATFEADFDLQDHEVFDITREYEAANFVDHCRSQPPNTLMILAAKGSIYVPPHNTRCLDTESLRTHSIALNYFDPGLKSRRTQLNDSGWYDTERSAEGVTRAWMRGRTSELWIEVTEPGPGSLHVRCSGLRNERDRRTLEVKVGGQSLGAVELPDRMTTFPGPSRKG